MNYDLFISPSTVGPREDMAQRAWPGASTVTRSVPALGDASTATRPLPESASDPLRTEEITNAVAAFNDVFEQAAVNVRYRVDEKTNDLVISLVDAETDKILRQIPPDAILKMRQRLQEMLGMLFDTVA